MCSDSCANVPKGTEKFPPDGWSYSPFQFPEDVTKIQDSNVRRMKLNDGYSYLYVFELFFDENLVNHFLKESKLKAENLQQKIYPKSKEDLFKYFLVILGMGIVQFPKVTLHWRRGDLIYESSMFAKLLSRNKYEMYRNCVTCNFTYVEEYLNFKFKSVRSPKNVLVVDECLVSFKGRFKGRQHIRGKPHATGLKFFVIADQSGYCVSFWLYKGKELTQKSSKPKDIVVDLVKSVLNFSLNDEPKDPDLHDYNLEEMCSVAAEETIDDTIDNLYNEDSDPNNDTILPVTSANYLVIADSFFGSLSCARELNKMNVFYILASRKNIDSWLKQKLMKLKKHSWKWPLQSLGRYFIDHFQ